MFKTIEGVYRNGTFEIPDTIELEESTPFIIIYVDQTEMSKETSFSQHFKELPIELSYYKKIEKDEGQMNNDPIEDAKGCLKDKNFSTKSLLQLQNKEKELDW